MSGDQWTREVMYAKIHYSPPKGGAFAPLLPPPPPPPPLNPPLLYTRSCGELELGNVRA